MKLKNIKIPHSFSINRPAEWKMKACREYYRMHGETGKTIIISPDGVLLDGYVGLLVLMENGVKEADVLISPEDEVRSNSQISRLYNRSIMYVTAKHDKGSKEYTWRVSHRTEEAEKIDIGSKIVVDTYHGKKRVTVCGIHISRKPPREGYIRSVLKLAE